MALMYGSLTKKKFWSVENQYLAACVQGPASSVWQPFI